MVSSYPRVLKESSARRKSPTAMSLVSKAQPPKANASWWSEAGILDDLADTHLALNHPNQAHDTWKHARELYQAQHRLTEAERVTDKPSATPRSADQSPQRQQQAG
jgi:hypothetical protein